ncbi:MAG: outer membrane beta-barrel protein [Bacteroidetes bacterium]|nr:outer membrane beta-barrel protein [Bacteroidota bacterium]MBS1739096.1 outer membrane beta-barrel protein [Bacteroidota bacterium]
MTPSEFDKLIKSKFEEHSFEYSAEKWDVLAHQLPNKKKYIPIGWIKTGGIAAGLMLFIGGIAWFFSKNNIQIVQVAQNKISTHVTPSIKPQQETQSTVIYPKQTKQIASLTQQKTTIKVQQISNRIQQKNFNSPTSTVQPNSQTDHAKEILPESNQPSNVDVVFSPKQSQLSKGSASVSNFTNPPKSDQKQKSTTINLAGGMNYGTLNTGFSAGINARQKLGEHFFVESDLAFVNNRAGQTFSPQAQQTAALYKMPIDYRNANLMYVQINPAVGYQVFKNISVGLGADLQQMVNGENTLVNVNDEIRTIPATDLGLIGKTEVSISPKFKAGLQYRSGINNLMNSSTGYFDRRYFQVQLKYAVFGK